MAKVSQTYGSGEFIKYDHLKGQTYTLRIESSRIHTFEPDDEKPGRTVIILGFLGTEKELQLNGRSARRLAEVYGDDTDGWIGKDVLLMPTPGSQAKFNSVDAYVPPTGTTPGTGPLGTAPQAPADPPPSPPAPTPAPSAPEPPPPSDDDIPF